MPTFEDPNYLQPADEQPVHDYIDMLWTQNQGDAVASLIRKATSAADVLTSITRIDTSSVYRPGHLASLLVDRISRAPVFYGDSGSAHKGIINGALMSKRGGGLFDPSSSAYTSASTPHAFMESPHCLANPDTDKKAHLVSTHTPVSLFSTDETGLGHPYPINVIEPLPWTGSVYFIGGAVDGIYFPNGLEIPSAYRKRDGLSLVIPHDDPIVDGSAKDANAIAAAYYGNYAGTSRTPQPAYVPIRDGGVSVDHLFVSLKGVAFATVAHARDHGLTTGLASAIESTDDSLVAIQGLIPTISLLNQRKELVLASNEAARAGLAAGIELHHAKLMSYYTGTKIGTRHGVYQSTADAIVGAVSDVYVVTKSSFTGTTSDKGSVNAYDKSLMAGVKDAYSNEVTNAFSDPVSNPVGQLIAIVSMFDTFIRAPFLSDDFNKAIKAQGIAALAACMFRYDVFRSKAILRNETISLVADLAATGGSKYLGEIVDEYVNRADSIYDRIAQSVDAIRSATNAADLVRAIKRFHSLSLPALAMVEDSLSGYLALSPHSDTAGATVITAGTSGRQPKLGTVFSRLSFGPSHYAQNKKEDPLSSTTGQSSQFDDMVLSYEQFMLAHKAFEMAMKRIEDLLGDPSIDEVSEALQLFGISLGEDDSYSFSEGDVAISLSDSKDATDALAGSQSSNMGAGDKPAEFEIKKTTANRDSATVSRVIARELSAIQELNAPHWVSQETQGTIDMQSWLNRGVGDVEIFRQWSETEHWRPRVEIVVAADVSGSMMRYADDLGQAFYAIAKAGKEIDAPTSCLLFNTEHHLHYDSEDPDSLDLSTPHAVSSHGGTSPLTTLYNIANGERRAEKRVVVILTDGEWFGRSNDEYKKVVSILNRSNDTSLGVMYFGDASHFVKIGSKFTEYGFSASQITMSVHLQDLVRLTKTLVSQFL